MLYAFGIACAAVFLTNGDISTEESRIASIMIGTITGTRIDERTRSADARIN